MFRPLQRLLSRFRLEGVCNGNSKILLDRIASACIKLDTLRKSGEEKEILGAVKAFGGLSCYPIKWELSKSVYSDRHAKTICIYARKQWVLCWGSTAAFQHHSIQWMNGGVVCDQRKSHSKMWDWEWRTCEGCWTGGDKVVLCGWLQLHVLKQLKPPYESPPPPPLL